VHDFPFGHLRFVDAPDLGNGRALRVGQRLLLRSGLGVLAAQPFHDEIDCALRDVTHKKLRRSAIHPAGRWIPA
jgi:hypothetical protein